MSTKKVVVSQRIRITMTSLYSHETIYWVNATLQNNESSTDIELVDYFVKGGLSVDDAQKAVSQRDLCLMDMFYKVDFGKGDK